MKLNKLRNILTHGYGSTKRMLSLSKYTTGSRGLITLIFLALQCSGSKTQDLLNAEFLPMLGIQSVSAADAQTLRVQFTDTVEAKSAVSLSNYKLIDEAGLAVTLNAAVVDEVTPSIVFLTTLDLTQSENYTLTVYNVAGMTKTKPIDAEGISLTFSGVAGTLADTAPPDILGPFEGEEVDLIAVITWTSKAGASEYYLEVATDAEFTNHIAGSPFTIAAPATSYQLDLTAIGGGTYYWRVRADTTLEGEYASGSFEVLDDFIYVYCPSTHAYCSDTDIHADGTNIIAVGHKAGPYRTIAGGIAEAVRLGKSEVRIAGRGDDGFGNPVAYNETIIIKDGVSVTGGYDSAFTAKDTSAVANQVVIESFSSYVAYAQGVTRTTVVDSISFVNTSTGLSASYGVKVDGSNNNLSFNNIHINGGSGASSFGVANLNSTEARFINSSITTGNSSVKAVAIWNNSSSLPTLDSVAITTGISTKTIGVLNQSGSNSGVIMTNSSIVTSDASDYSVGIGGINAPGGSVDISNSKIVTGIVSTGESHGIYAETGTVTSSAIHAGETANAYGLIKICNADAPINTTVTGNLLTTDSNGIGRGIEVCNNYSTDTITIENNTIAITGTHSNGVHIAGVSSINAGLNIDNNMVFETGASTYDTGINIEQANLSSLDNNLIWNMRVLTGVGGREYGSVCADSGIVGTGTFGGAGMEVINMDNGLADNNIQDIKFGTNAMYISTHKGGIGISTDGGKTFTVKTTIDGLANDNVNRLALISGAAQSQDRIYAATQGGLSYSGDGGITWSTITGLSAADSFIRMDIIPGGTQATDTLVLGSNQQKGLAISNNGGASWAFHTVDNSGSCTCTGGSGANAPYQGLDLCTGDATVVNSCAGDGGTGSWTYGIWYNSINDIVVIPGVPDTIYAATGIGISISSDNGATWTTRRKNVGLISNNIQRLLVNGTTVYAATNAGISISQDGGATFTISKSTADGLSSNNLREIAASGNMLYVGTVLNGLNISSDGGNSWQMISAESGLISNSAKLVRIDNGKVYIGTTLGISILSSPSFSWKNYTQADGLGSNLVFSTFVSGSHWYAGTQIYSDNTGGGLSVSTDHGTTWTNLTNLTSNHIADVFSNGKTLFGIAYSHAGTGVFNARASYSLDFGATWTNYATGTSGHNIFSSGYNVYQASSSLILSFDQGVTFLKKNSIDGLPVDITKDVFVSNDIIYAATAGGGLALSHDRGNTWTTLNVDNTGRCSDNVSLTLDACEIAGALWTYGVGGDYIEKVYVHGNTVYLASKNQSSFPGGGISISEDHGLSWKTYNMDNTGSCTCTGGSNASAPYVTLFHCEDVAGTCAIDGGTGTWSYGLANNWFHSIDAYDSVIYTGSNKGLYVSNNNGAVWTEFTVDSTGSCSDGVSTTLVACTGAAATWTYGLTNNIVRDIFADTTGIYIATDNGLSVAEPVNQCTARLSNSQLGIATPGFPTGNKTAVYTTDVFDPAVYNELDPTTWHILPSGPADLDNSGGWSVGDIGADTVNVGIPSGVVPGAGW